MAQYSMTCACGDKLAVDAETREEAVEKLKGIMDEETIKAHMEGKHPGEPVMSVEDCHKMIEEQTAEVAA